MNTSNGNVELSAELWDGHSGVVLNGILDLLDFVVGVRSPGSATAWSIFGHGHQITFFEAQKPMTALCLADAGISINRTQCPESLSLRFPLGNTKFDVHTLLKKSLHFDQFTDRKTP